MADITYTPSNVTESATMGTSDIQFGDGYKQVVPNGINNRARTWSVDFTDLTHAEADALTDLFKVRAGSQSMTWRVPGDAADIKVVCKQYSRPMQNRVKAGSFTYNVSAQFEEVWF